MAYPNGRSQTTSPDDPSPQSLLVDDFLRRKLRVGDPRSVKEVAEALRERYAAEAQRIDAEGRGLPLVAALQRAPSAGDDEHDTAGTRAYERALGNAQADLDRLLVDPATREWVPELSGWKSKLLREVKAGADAARLAQDAAQREQAFLAVRRLGEYARVARLIGQADSVVMPPYRRLGRSLDTCSGAIRVFVGEALEAAGLGEGGIVMSVPVADARQRRDALLLALGRLVGTILEGRDTRATGAYAWLLKTLESAAPELRVYVRVPSLTQALDDLLAEVSRQDPEALRTVASTAPITLAHLGQLREMRHMQGAPQSRALDVFFEALGLFRDAFGDEKSGARFVELALPIPLGAEEVRDLDTDGRRLLRELVHFRADYAYDVDRWAAERSGSLDVNGDAILAFDHAQYLIDRAVDFFLQGNGRDGAWQEEEIRAAVYVFFAQETVEPELTTDSTAPAGRLDAFATEFVTRIFGAGVDPANSSIYADVVSIESEADKAWLKLAASLSPRSV